jgi:hypothetical protein
VCVCVYVYTHTHRVGLRGLVVSVLAIGPKVRVFKPGRRRRILEVIIRSTISLEGK